MDRNSIIELAAILKVRTGGTKGANIAFQCPLAPISGEHAKDYDKNPSFYIKVDDDGPSVCNCLGCGRKGRLLSWFKRAQWEFGGFEEAVAFIEQREVKESLAKALDRLDQEEEKRTPYALTVERTVRAAKEIYPEGLRERGITDLEIQRYELGTDIVQERYLFPVWDRQKKLVGAVGRTYVDSSLRYLSYHDFDARDYFYGEHEIDSTRGSGVLVEGPADRIKTARVLPNVLGLFGDQITPARKRKLKRWFDSITIMMDGDRAGRVSEIRIGSTLAPFMRVYVARLPWGFDPDDAGSARILRAYSNRTFWANLA